MVVVLERYQQQCGVGISNRAPCENYQPSLFLLISRSAYALFVPKATNTHVILSLFSHHEGHSKRMERGRNLALGYA